MRFEFSTAHRIIFGEGAAQQLPDLARALGSRALLLTGHALARHSAIIDPLEQAGLLVGRHTAAHEPDIDLIQQLTDEARAAEADMIIALGGGSVIDAGKAVAALLANPGDLLDYLEVIGRGQTLAAPSVPVLAVPTTAGTGAEVTRNAVLAVPGEGERPGLKVSLRSPYMLPTIALIDPLLTYSLPPDVTAATGMDALTQCLEPYVSSQANPLADAFAQEGLRRAARSLRQAFQVGDDAAARADMALASLCGGLALANAKLGAVHGFAGVIGGMFPAPHGAVCARLLPATFEVNCAAVASRGEAAIQKRFSIVSSILTGAPTATPQDGVAWLHALVEELSIPRLGQYGLNESDFPTIIEAALHSSSMQGNPAPLTSEECAAILHRAL